MAFPSVTAMSVKKWSGLRRRWQRLRVPRSFSKLMAAHLNFYRLHLAYFIVLAFIGTAVIWMSPKPKSHVTLVDALFNVTSALCVTGLVSVRMSQLSQFDKACLMFLIVLGSQAFTSLLPVYFRRYYFKQYIRQYVSGRPSIRDEEGGPPGLEAAEVEEGGAAAPPAPTPGDDDTSFRRRSFAEASPQEARRSALVLGVTKALSASKSLKDLLARAEEDEVVLDVSSSRALEHRSLICLSWLVPTFFIGVQLTCFLLLELYFVGAPDALQSLRERDVDRTFYTLFTTVSAFANAGISLVDESLVLFQKSVLLLLLVCVLILLGNTLFAPCFRLLIWLLHRVSTGDAKCVYKYLLKHPRKCYTHLFPQKQTLWLLLTVLAFNAVQIVAFCALDWESTALRGFGWGYKLVMAVFQSVSTRSAGFQVVYLGELSSAMLVLYVGMMYIAAYPVFLSRQNTKAQKELYDEADLGVYAQNWESELVASKISAQAKQLLARDSAYLFISVLVICIIQNQDIKKDSLNYSIFNIVFEVISAYGNVGLSIGYSCDLARRMNPSIDCQDVPYSLSGKWSNAGKAIMVVVMFLGRHRGLPDNIDSAIQLPRRKDFSRHRTLRNSHLKDSAVFAAARSSISDGYKFTAPPHTSPPSFRGVEAPAESEQNLKTESPAESEEDATSTQEPVPEYVCVPVTSSFIPSETQDQQHLTTLNDTLSNSTPPIQLIHLPPSHS